MRFAVVGAGAIGAFLGAKLSLSGHQVYLIARGPHLQAMQAHGVRVRSQEGDFQAHPVATDDYDQVGEVDFHLSNGQGPQPARGRPPGCRRCWGRKQPSCRPRTASRGGTSSVTAALWREDG